MFKSWGYGLNTFNLVYINFAKKYMDCGRLTNNSTNYFLKIYIVYFDSNNECHDLTFNLGQAAMGATIPSRQFSIKVMNNQKFKRKKITKDYLHFIDWTYSKFVIFIQKISKFFIPRWPILNAGLIIWLLKVAISGSLAPKGQLWLSIMEMEFI